MTIVSERKECVGVLATEVPEAFDSVLLNQSQGMDSGLRGEEGSSNCILVRSDDSCERT